jgi:hypothetical protein
METVNIVRCWKNLTNDHRILVAVILNKFKNKFNFSFTITITHSLDEHVKQSILNYVEEFNNLHNTNHKFTTIPLQTLDQFARTNYEIDENIIDLLKQQPVLYNVLLGFYTRAVLNLDYVLFHNDNILYTRQEVPLLENLLSQKAPFSLHHPYTFSDFSLVGKLTLLLQKDVYTPYSNKGMSASNTALMGINLSILDIFTTQTVKKLFTEIFKYDSFADEGYSNHFKDGMFSFNLYCQEQSFYSLLVRARNKEFTILPNAEGYQIYLTDNDVKANNPLIHYYIYDLKFNGYHRTFLDYYDSRMVSGLNLFAEY